MSTQKEIALLGNIVVFEKRKTYDDCKHLKIILCRDDREIECQSCKVKLNPVEWLGNWMPYINGQLKKAREQEAKTRVIEEKLQSKSRFACTHCHEVNTIQFDKLASKAAIERKLKVMDDEESLTSSPT